MANLYFDESIRDKGGFIVGALIVTEVDLAVEIRQRWLDMGLDPAISEYKSSAPKSGNPQSQQQRDILADLLRSAKLGFTICPLRDRTNLGQHCASLIFQLQRTKLLEKRSHDLFVDQNIFISREDRGVLEESGVRVHLHQDSRVAAGIQLADHCAHALGGMLLEEIGIVRKIVLAGENSGYDPELEIELGFELWAMLRYSLLGVNEHIPGLSPPPDDLTNPFFRVDGYGMFLSPSCPPAR